MFGKKSKDMQVTEEQIRESLKNVKYPGFSRDIVSFGIVNEITVKNKEVSIGIQVTAKNMQAVEKIEQDIKKEINALPGVLKVDVVKSAGEPPKSPHRQHKNLIERIHYKIAVASGKGGVGKSTVSVNLAAALNKEGFRVGLYDCDIYGPSIPMMMGVKEKQPFMRDNKILPIENYGIKLMSIGFFTPKDTPLIWRGPMIHKSIEQMLGDVEWGELDYLIIDLPPGTGDAQISIAQLISLSGSIIVTTPQDISLIDAAKGVMMFRKINVPIIGIVENMSYFVCPHCHKETDIFARGGGRRESERLNVPFLGEVPLIPEIREGGDRGIPWVIREKNSSKADVCKTLAQNVVKTTESAIKIADEEINIKIV